VSGAAVFVTVAGWWQVALAADRDTVRLLAAIGRLWPWWGESAASIVRNGPVVLVFLWMLNGLLLPDDAGGARAAQLRSLALAAFLATLWAIAWAALAWPEPARWATFAPAARAEAATSALPLGAAALALASGDATGFGGRLGRLVALAYALSRLAIGADSPLEALAEATSAAVGTWLVSRPHRVRVAIDALARDLAAVLGLGGEAQT
jgi:hypothetical protein